MGLIPTTQRDKIMAGVCALALGLVYAYYAYLWSPKEEAASDKKTN